MKKLLITHEQKKHKNRVAIQLPKRLHEIHNVLYENGTWC